VGPVRLPRTCGMRQGKERERAVRREEEGSQKSARRKKNRVSSPGTASPSRMGSRPDAKKPGTLFGEPGLCVFLSATSCEGGEERLATSYFRTTLRRTIIGAAAFHFRVRNGNGWGHCAMITRGTRGREVSLLWRRELTPGAGSGDFLAIVAVSFKKNRVASGLDRF
jgi:hypothetical protein